MPQPIAPPLHYRNRNGTSFKEFMHNFPDSAACLEHVFYSRFGPNADCPSCNREAKWWRIRSSNTYRTNCCETRSIYPLTGTIFFRSSTRLWLWFLAILQFCNTSSGVSVKSISSLLGVTHKASFRMCGLIRGHLAELDRGNSIGRDGQTVYVVETTISRIRSHTYRGTRKARILGLGNGKDVAAIVLPSGHFRLAVDALRERVGLNCPIEFRDEETLVKVFDHRPRLERAKQMVVSSDPSQVVFAQISSFLANVKVFLLRTHRMIDHRFLDRYIGHYSYLFNLRHDGGAAFWRAISNFPAQQSLRPAAHASVD